MAMGVEYTSFIGCVKFEFDDKSIYTIKTILSGDCDVMAKSFKSIRIINVELQQK